MTAGGGDGGYSGGGDGATNPPWMGGECHSKRCHVAPGLGGICRDGEARDPAQHNPHFKFSGPATN